MVRINWWKDSWLDRGVSRTAWFYNTGSTSTIGWIEFKPSEELHAALCIMPTGHFDPICALYEIEEDLFESLGYEVVERNHDD